MTATALRNNLIMVFKQELHPPEQAELLPPDAYYLAERMLADDWPDDVGELLLEVALFSRSLDWVSTGMKPVGPGDVVAIRGIPYILTTDLRDKPIQHTSLKYKEHWRWRQHLTASGCIPYSP